MRTKFVEAAQDLTGGSGNWGKFMVAEFDDVEWARRSQLHTDPPGRSLLREIGNGGGCFVVFDLQTGEGFLVQGAGYARADLDKHRVWVCPLFEPFLVWLYEHIREVGVSWFEQLPGVVELPAAGFALYGHRRPGPVGESSG